MLYRLRWWLPWICPLLGGLVLQLSFLGSTCGGPGQWTETQLLTVVSRLDAFRLEYGRYPTTDEGLEALLTPPQRPNGRSPGPLMDGASSLLDGWGNPLLYLNEVHGCEEGYVLWSRGHKDVSAPAARRLVETRCRRRLP